MKMKMKMKIKLNKFCDEYIKTVYPYFDGYEEFSNLELFDKIKKISFTKTRL